MTVVNPDYFQTRDLDHETGITLKKVNEKKKT